MHTAARFGVGELICSLRCQLYLVETVPASLVEAVPAWVLGSVLSVGPVLPRSTTCAQLRLALLICVRPCACCASARLLLAEFKQLQLLLPLFRACSTVLAQLRV